jgi:hypothetical protein
VSKKSSNGAAEVIMEVIFFLCIVVAVVSWIFS